MKPAELLNKLDPAIIRDALAPLRGEPDGNGCIPFTGFVRPNGYGVLSINSVRFSAHRAAWVAANGPMDPKVDACHSCDNRPCINDTHVFPGTRSENMIDCRDKGRLNTFVIRGVHHVTAKLTQAQVDEIRSSKVTAVALGEKFNVDPSTIRGVRRGATYRT